jgi:hypothetical protein
VRDSFYWAIGFIDCIIAFRNWNIIMKIRNKTLLAIISLTLLVLPASAQSGMEEYFYQSGKIKVVIGVAAIVLVGLLIYLWRLDNRVTRMEKEQKGGKS